MLFFFLRDKIILSFLNILAKTSKVKQTQDVKMNQSNDTELKPSKKKFSLIDSDDDEENLNEKLSSSQMETIKMFESKLNLGEKQANKVS